MDCGPACIKIIAQYLGKNLSFQKIKDNSYLTRQGVSFLGLMECSKKFHLSAVPYMMTLEQLVENKSFPCIIHWGNNHFVVVYKVEKGTVYVSDPRNGLLRHKIEAFKRSWLTASGEGAVLTFQKVEGFDEQEEDQNKKGNRLSVLSSYITQHKRTIVQLIIGVLVTALLQLGLPFLTKNLIDKGVYNNDFTFILLVAAFQIFLIVSVVAIQVVQAWIILQLTTTVSIKMIYGFLEKLLHLPMNFHNTKQSGDILQRINDHTRIKTFFSNQTLLALFGLVTLIVFTVILGFFSLEVLLIFLLGNTGYLIWSLFFMKKRALIDHEIFRTQADNQSSLIEIINSIVEIKLNGSYLRRINDWKAIQYEYFKVSLSGLSLFNKQRHIGILIAQSTSILILLYTAKMVIDGDLSLGTMLAIQFITVQANLPLQNLLSFFFKLQDTTLSLERISEVHNHDSRKNLISKSNQPIETYDGDIKLTNISFWYGPPGSNIILDTIDLVIPQGKMTAIVGESGTGKSTLLKLILNLIQPSQGTIDVGPENLKDIDLYSFRASCGVVLQDGYIFSDTIERNITESKSNQAIDITMLQKAIDVANLNGFISNCENGLKTLLGKNGISLSGGEKQKILIARAVYKNPNYIFFDEATSNLDASNESLITNRLSSFFEGRTMVVIAHRLSTIKQADKIVVLKNGKISEEGNHSDLLQAKGVYYGLIDKQLT